MVLSSTLPFPHRDAETTHDNPGPDTHRRVTLTLESRCSLPHSTVTRPEGPFGGPRGIHHSEETVVATVANICSWRGVFGSEDECRSIRLFSRTGTDYSFYLLKRVDTTNTRVSDNLSETDGLLKFMGMRKDGRFLI